MLISRFRELVHSGAYVVYDHAIMEGFKDGISVDDMKQAVFNGRIIEEYPDRSRCLVLGKTIDGRSIHVVVDCSGAKEIEFVTTYLPSIKSWAKGFSERKK